MKYILLSVALLSILSCGVVAPLELSNSLPTITPTDVSKPIYQPTAEKAIYRMVEGCWNLRETAGGADIGEVCNMEVKIIERVGDWAHTPFGWICVRAFGEKAECQTN